MGDKAGGKAVVTVVQVPTGAVRALVERNH